MQQNFESQIQSRHNLNYTIANKIIMYLIFQIRYRFLFLRIHTESITIKTKHLYYYFWLNSSRFQKG